MNPIISGEGGDLCAPSISVSLGLQTDKVHAEVDGGRESALPPSLKGTTKGGGPTRALRPSLKATEAGGPQPPARRKNSPVTQACAAKIRSLSGASKGDPQEWSRVPFGRLSTLAQKLHDCATEPNFRCGSSTCPRCSAWRARRRKQELCDRIANIGSQTILAHVTVTIAANEPKEGLDHLKMALLSLRRSAAWKKAVVGGHIHFELIRSRGAVCSWNVHAHLLIEVFSRASLASLRALQQVWPPQAQQAAGLAGTLHVEEVADRGCHGREHRTIAYYTTKRPWREALDLPPKEFAELLLATLGQRLTWRFGRWHKASGL